MDLADNKLKTNFRRRNLKYGKKGVFKNKIDIRTKFWLSSHHKGPYF